MPTSKTLVRDIRADLLARVDPVYKKGATRFFKEEVLLLGVRTPVHRKLAKQYWKQIKDWSTKQVYELCEDLFARGTMEESMIAFAFARELKDRILPSDFPRMERWLKRYVTNWALCDEFCTHALGALIHRHPELLQRTVAWRSSKNRWLRRASAVILIYPWRKENNFLQDIFETADALLLDEDDMVQKGYGWMLKVAADFHTKEVHAFVMERRDRMPRTALRYAIEKMPPAMKKRAMARP